MRERARGHVGQRHLPFANSATAISTRASPRPTSSIERSFRPAATHQGYIEPHACLASLSDDGRGDLWTCTQGHFIVRDVCAAVLGIEASPLRVTPSEIGGGFGGKTTVCSSSRWRWRCRARRAGR